MLVNNADIFKPFAKFWLEPICNFIIADKTGGKGFHYFLRDLVSLLILWSDNYKVTQEQSILVSNVINTLVRISADKNKFIFNINIELLAVLLDKWRSAVVLDKD
jgi:hypothetical protein